MISLTPLPEPLTDNPARLAETTQTIFSQRRKQLGSILGRDRPGGWPAGIRPDQRAEELSVEQIVALAAGAGTL